MTLALDASSPQSAAALDKVHRRGTHRARAPADTLARVWPLAAAMGITRLANITGLDLVGIPVAQATRPNACSNAVTQGKGLDLASARVSALMEAVESFHAERGGLPMRYCSAADLGRALRLVAVERLPRIAGSRYHDHLDMLWVEGEDLFSGEPMWVPYETVHARFKQPYPPGSGCFPMSTTGLASGNHRLEAIVHGLCEVIERDATTLFELQPQSRQARRLDPASLDDADCRSLLDRFARADLISALWDETSDLGIPVMACHAIEGEDGPGLVRWPAAGHGCHPDRVIATLRALTEAAQSRLTVISGARDDVAPRDYQGWFDRADLASWRRFVAGSRGGRLFAELPHLTSDSFAADLTWLLDRLRAAGIEQAVAVDLALEPELPYAVVRVIVPGLEPVRGRDYQPGARARMLPRP